MTDLTQGQIGSPIPQGQGLPQGPTDPAMQAAIQAAQAQQAAQQAEIDCEHELEKAVCQMAVKGQLADTQADAAWRYGQAAYYYAQALQVLRTPIAPAAPVGQMSGERPVGDGQSGP